MQPAFGGIKQHLPISHLFPWKTKFYI